MSPLPRLSSCTPSTQRSPFPIATPGLGPPKVPCMWLWAALGQQLPSPGRRDGEDGWARRGCGSVGTHFWLLAQLIPLELAGSGHRCSPRSCTGTEPSVWGWGWGWGCKGLPCHLLLPAGLESPSHALRADADPWASSATTTCVTLAEPHRYDRNLEIILYPCGEGGRCPWWVWGRWGVAPKASGASPSPLRHGVAPNPAVPPRAPPPPPGDGGRHHDVPRVRGPRPEPPGLHADRQEGWQWRETGDRARPPPAQRGGGGRGEVVGCG